MTISGAEFLLRDLDGLLESRIAVDGSKSKSGEDDGRRISKILYDLVNQDCNFGEQRDVDFSIAVFDSWSDYQQYLEGDPDLIWDLLAKYQDALSDLRDKAPSYISQMKYNKDESKFEDPEVITAADASHLRHFEDLVRGYKKHLDLLDQGTPQGLKLRRSLVEAFQASTCNRSLTEARLGWSIDPLSDPKLFAPCKR